MIQTAKSSKGNITKEMEVSLSQLSTVTEKLDFWHGIFNTQISEPLEKINSENPFVREKLLFKLFGKGCKLISPLLIPETIYNSHFKDALKNPEFTYWFLKYNAANWLQITKELHNIDEKLNSPLALLHIEGELKEINDFEQRANQLLIDKKIDYYKEYSYSQHSKEIEYLRIRADYYKTHWLYFVQAIGNTTVTMYAKHILFKEYLQKELIRLQNSLPPIEDAYKNSIWFKVGLLFANGEMGKLQLKHDNNATAIARELGNKNYRPYISETISNTNTTDKNIYANADKVLKIYNHCIENNISIIESFQQIQSK